MHSQCITIRPNKKHMHEFRLKSFLYKDGGELKRENCSSEYGVKAFLCLKDPCDFLQ